ncbi:MAG: RidA family protein [Rhodospirillaceae bacterium]|nr:RidA family protein [Rhodospirillaceae bacterium]MCY4238395.1 RidA family protein [Rhodospirillaceae bacterium]MCY4309990.1 RidA family protein [Rhodospirillaceae bacterium]
MQFLQPPDWPRAKGYSNGIAARGTMVFVAGEIGWDPMVEKILSDDFTTQFRQALENTVAILKEADAKPEHIVRMTWFITDKKAYLNNAKAIGKAYRDVIGRHFPVMAVIEVKSLMEPGAMVEIETTAVIPD